jgi:hypothetical protein
MVSVEFEASLVTAMDPAELLPEEGANVAVSVAVCDGFNVAGVDNPLTEKPVPVAATLEIFTAALPVLVKIICFGLLLPVATVPKLTLVALADSRPAAEVEPVPLNAIVSVEFEASLVTVMDPAELPTEEGANVAVSVAVCDGFNVAGVDRPLTEKPVPVAATLEIFTAALPEFVKTICFGMLVPVASVPKLTLAGLVPSCPTTVLAVPFKPMVRAPLLASLLTVIEPVSLPAAVGLNLAVSVAVCEGFNVTGVESPLTEKPVPVAATLETFTAALPVLVKTICFGLLLPVATVPKLTLVALADSRPTAEVEPVPLSATVPVGLFGSLLVMTILPAALTALVGEKVTVL